MDIAQFKAAAIGAFCASMLPACVVTDNAYFVKPDGSPATLAGLAELAQLPPATQALTLGVTFKSAGKVSPTASDSLYQSVCGGLKAKGPWEIRRIGRAGDDFAAQIAAVKPVPLNTATTKTATTATSPVAKMLPRILVLVENSPDTSAATTASYVLSGMTYGGARVHKPTDRYDVTIAYRDADGIERIYHGHQDLVFATGSKIFGRDPSPGEGYKRYDSSVAAFNGIVDNSVNGTRRGKVTVGAAHPEPTPATPTPAPAARPLEVRKQDLAPRQKAGIRLLATDEK
ncbi:MAG: hypothetical protein JWR16_2872 [Nevskia sp.]|nr:hypothetical protein [Nevskia sp.]